MKTLGNLIWLLFGGLVTAIEYFAASIPLFISIIGIPFGIQTIKLGMLCIWPFGTEIRVKPGNPGCISTIMNIFWFLIGGIWICLTHVLFGVILCITIIGIPFGKQHFKMASLALMPFGRQIIQS
ncbi:MAG: YccF domain-containing protein [Salinivirgaceae bacterium]|nr:YccF domain-containing protein [Salinivirgaceae bacterium]